MEPIVAGYRLRWKLFFHQLCLPAISPWHAPTKLKEGQPGHLTTNYKLLLHYIFFTGYFINEFCSISSDNGTKGVFANF